MVKKIKRKAPLRKQKVQRTQSAKKGATYWTDSGGQIRIVIWLDGEPLMRPNRSFASRPAARVFVRKLRAALA